MSPRRRQILQLVHDSLASTGVSPSINEMADRFGTSKAAIVAHIGGLVAEGWLTRRGGLNAKRSLEVVKLPGRGLLMAEVAWCYANPERVRAMMALVGARIEQPDCAPARSGAVPGFAVSDVAAAARPLIDALKPGGEIEISLPPRHPERLHAYHRVSLIATRRWGRGAVTRSATPNGVILRRHTKTK